jgi:hypothetical protein
VELHAQRVTCGNRLTLTICERFHKTMLDEFYRVAFRKKVYRAIEELQADLDEWMSYYNEARTHQGRWCFGKTPMQTFLDSRHAHGRPHAGSRPRRPAAARFGRRCPQNLIPAEPDHAP